MRKRVVKIVQFLEKVMFYKDVAFKVKNQNLPRATPPFDFDGVMAQNNKRSDFVRKRVSGLVARSASEVTM